MKLKGLIIIVILTIITLPSINAQFNSKELSTNDDTEIIAPGYDFIFVAFAFGRITNLEEFNIGYVSMYGFDAIDVICILATENHPLPFIYRFRDGERLGMAYPTGIITEHFIWAS